MKRWSVYFQWSDSYEHYFSLTKQEKREMIDRVAWVFENRKYIWVPEWKKKRLEKFCNLLCRYDYYYPFDECDLRILEGIENSWIVRSVSAKDLSDNA